MFYLCVVLYLLLAILDCLDKNLYYVLVTSKVHADLSPTLSNYLWTVICNIHLSFNFYSLYIHDYKAKSLLSICLLVCLFVLFEFIHICIYQDETSFTWKCLLHPELFTSLYNECSLTVVYKRLRYNIKANNAKGFWPLHLTDKIRIESLNVATYHSANFLLNCTLLMLPNF